MDKDAPGDVSPSTKLTRQDSVDQSNRVTTQKQGDQVNSLRK